MFVHTFCIDAPLITVEAKWVFVFSETICLTMKCLWHNELLYVSNLNFEVVGGYKYKDLEQLQ